MRGRVVELKGWDGRPDRRTCSSAPNVHKERAPNPGAHPAQFMSGFMGGKLKWAESPNATNQLSGRQSYAAATALSPPQPTTNRIYNNHRQLTWRTTDLYLLAMVAGL